jgi:hypothetical protein
MLFGDRESNLKLKTSQTDQVTLNVWINLPNLRHSPQRDRDSHIYLSKYIGNKRMHSQSLSMLGCQDSLVYIFIQTQISEFLVLWPVMLHLTYF